MAQNDKTKAIYEGYNPKNGHFICHGTDTKLLKLYTDWRNLTKNTFNWLVLDDVPKLVLDIQKWSQVKQEREKMPLLSIPQILKILVMNRVDISKILKYVNDVEGSVQLGIPDFTAFAITNYDQYLDLQSTLEKLNRLFEDLFPGYPDFMNDFMGFLVTNATDIDLFYLTLNDDNRDH